MTKMPAQDSRSVPKGPVVLSLVFVAAAMAMPFVGTLPLHLAIACKVMALIYATWLMSIAFAPLRRPDQSVEEAYGSRPLFAPKAPKGNPARA